jgi:hypothetical protein
MIKTTYNTKGNGMIKFKHIHVYLQMFGPARNYPREKMMGEI